MGWHLVALLVRDGKPAEQPLGSGTASPQPEPRRRAGREALRQHVAVLQQGLQDGWSLAVRDVEAQALLRAIGLDEVRGLADALR